MSDLRTVPFDPEYIPGAHNAVHVCLRIQPDEKVTLITDHACLEIAASLAAELDRWVRRIKLSYWKNWRRGRWSTCRRRFSRTWKPAT